MDYVKFIHSFAASALSWPGVSVNLYLIPGTLDTGHFREFKKSGANGNMLANPSVWICSKILKKKKKEKVCLFKDLFINFPVNKYKYTIICLYSFTLIGSWLFRHPVKSYIFFHFQPGNNWKCIMQIQTPWAASPHEWSRKIVNMAACIVLPFIHLWIVSTASSGG